MGASTLVLEASGEVDDALLVTDPGNASAASKKERKASAKGASSVSSGVRLENVAKARPKPADLPWLPFAAGRPHPTVCFSSAPLTRTHALLCAAPHTALHADLQGSGPPHRRLLGGQEG